MLDKLVYFLRPHFVDDFEAGFEEVAKAGVRRVVLGPVMGDVVFLKQDHVARARGILARLNLEAVASHGLLFAPFDLNEAENRSTMLESHRRLMGHMAEMGCRTYTCHSGRAPEGHARDPLWDRVRSTLDDLVPVAQSLGLTIALENLPPGHLGDNAEELIQFVDGHADPHIGICYDSGHAHVEEDAVSVLRTLTPHVVTAHLHDNDGSSDQHRIPGLGTIDWAMVVPLLRQCPQLLHIETEAFNTEKWNHRDVYKRYCEIFSEPAHAPDRGPCKGDALR